MQQILMDYAQGKISLSCVMMQGMGHSVLVTNVVLDKNSPAPNVTADCHNVNTGEEYQEVVYL